MKKIIHLWNRIGIWISGITLFLLMLLTASDVCGRFVFKHAITGTNDLTQLMMVLIIFMALADTASTDGHIAVEVVTAQLSLKKSLILKCITSFISGIVSATMAWRLAANSFYVFRHVEITPILEISRAPFIFISAIGCGMLAIALLVISYDSFLQVVEKRKETEYDSS